MTCAASAPPAPCTDPTPRTGRRWPGSPGSPKRGPASARPGEHAGTGADYLAGDRAGGSGPGRQPRPHEAHRAPVRAGSGPSPQARGAGRTVAAVGPTLANGERGRCLPGPVGQAARRRPLVRGAPAPPAAALAAGDRISQARRGEGAASALDLGGRVVRQPAPLGEEQLGAHPGVGGLGEGRPRVHARMVAYAGDRSPRRARRAHGAAGTRRWAHVGPRRGRGWRTVPRSEGGWGSGPTAAPHRARGADSGPAGQRSGTRCPLRGPPGHPRRARAGPRPPGVRRLAPAPRLARRELGDQQAVAPVASRDRELTTPTPVPPPVQPSASRPHPPARVAGAR